MSEPDPPVISRSPRGTIIVRVRRSVQVAAARVVLGPLVKFVLGAVAAAIGVAAWRC